MQDFFQFQLDGVVLSRRTQIVFFFSPNLMCTNSTLEAYKYELMDEFLFFVQSQLKFVFVSSHTCK